MPQQLSSRFLTEAVEPPNSVKKSPILGCDPGSFRLVVNPASTDLLLSGLLAPRPRSAARQSSTIPTKAGGRMDV